MSEVTIIGLGPMGIALTRALLKDGYRVTVWNRTAEKADPLVREGAVLASNAASAVEASPITIICVANYETSYKILDTKEVIPALADRVLIQLTTGSPKEARDYEAWAHKHAADYLDGAIAATPGQMGRPETTIFVSGARTALLKSEAILKSLAGNVPYLGEQAGSASAFDLGFLSYLYGSFLGFMHGARIFESEGHRVDALGSMLLTIAPFIGEMIKHMGETIQKGDFENPESSLKTSAVGLEMFLQQAREAKINAEFPAFAMGLFKRAMEAGYGDEKVAAIIKVLREEV
ncbi:NAD(P)-dependent oxidoreductase [Paenibacillus sp. GCM10027628]|uniref:NAD(P)-dependent oxidoreductase n=1 Tax=Paenibacillus sp. GCM10027628 TaxID=3273413 RepID=UPI00363FAA3C